MGICKRFLFQSGWEFQAELVSAGLLFTLSKGGKRMRFYTQDQLQGPGPIVASLLNGRVSAEETAGAWVLHACPVDEKTGAPQAELMVHYRLERAGENAVRVTSWFGSREPLVADRLSWLSLRADRRDFDSCWGFDPDERQAVDAFPHGVHYGSAALCGPLGWVMLTDCGEADYIPNAGFWDAAAGQGIFEKDAPLCALAARPGALRHQDLSLWDEAHPLSAVIAFGEGEPQKPAVQPLVPAPCAQPQGTQYDLTSGRLTVAVRARERGISLLGISLQDFSPAPEASLLPLCRLTLQALATGERLSLTSEHDWERVQVRSSKEHLDIYLDRPRGIPLSVAVEARAAQPDTIIWRVKVLNASPDYTVLSASYPGISFAGENMSFFKPSASGRVEEAAFTREERWLGNYPTGFEGVAPVLGVYDAEKKKGSGLYVAVHAPAAARKEMSCAFFRRGQGFFCFDYPAENLGRPANSFALNGELVVRVLDGDWYDMACIYEAYIRDHAEWYRPLGRKDSPAWMRDVPMYIMDWMPNDNPDADPVPISIRPPKEPPRDNWYKKPIELAQRLGLPIGYHLYNWHFIPFNNDFPHYFPVKEGLEKGVEEMHRYGIHVMPYVNGRICDTRDSRGETVRFNQELRPGATKGPDGTLDIETYASHEPDGSLCRLAAMCPSSPVWKETLANIMRRLFKDYHMDAVYIDQVAAAQVNLCCDPAHGHTPGNGEWWVKEYRLLMERLRQERPEGCGFTTESNAEPYADQFDGFLTWAWVYPNMVPFFSKIYAGHIALLGRNTNGYKKGDAQYFRFHVGQAVMFGQQIGWINADVVDVPEKMDFLERMCHMRWDFRAYFSEGEMLRPPKVSGGDSFLTDCSMGMDEMQPACVVQASAWRLPEAGKVLVAVVNTGDTPVQARLAFDAAYGVTGQGAARFYGEGKLCAADRNGLEATLQAASCLTIVFDGEEKK